MEDDGIVKRGVRERGAGGGDPRCVKVSEF